MAHTFPTWTTVKIWTRRCLRHVQQWCRHTWHRLAHEPGYAEALAALAVAATELFIRGEAARRFLTELVHTLLTVIRALFREPPDLDGGWA